MTGRVPVWMSGFNLKVDIEMDHVVNRGGDLRS